MIDTRADLTNISVNTWPQSWPTTAVGSVVAGLWGTTQSYLTSKSVLVKNTEGQMTIDPSLCYCYATQPMEKTCCQHGEFGWEQIFNEGHCAEGCKASYVSLEMAHWTTCVGWSVVPWKRKIKPLKLLAQEKLNQGHTEPSASPWNTPVFVITKKSGKWRLLHDFRKIN